MGHVGRLRSAARSWFEGRSSTNPKVASVEKSLEDTALVVAGEAVI